MSRNVSGNPEEIRKELLILLHRSATYADARPPHELLMLAEAYARILHPDQPRGALPLPGDR